VVEDFTFETAKTKEFVNFAKNFKVDGKKVLVVLADQNNNVYLSSRNVPGARLMRAADINTYAVLNNNAIILTESSLAVINNL
jgi:large subunit ribosomal protein L4